MSQRKKKKKRFFFFMLLYSVARRIGAHKHGVVPTFQRGKGMAMVRANQLAVIQNIRFERKDVHREVEQPKKNTIGINSY